MENNGFRYCLERQHLTFSSTLQRVGDGSQANAAAVVTMMVKPLPPHASSPYYGDAAFNAFMPMAAVYTLIANLAVGILRPLGLFPRPKPLLIAPDTNKGKLAIVTGSNTGIGFETAQALVNSGFDVILACRSRDKALQAIDRIHQQRTSIEGKALFLCPLDLSSLESVKEFSDAVKARYSQVHVLVNNAGRNSSPQDASCNGLNVCFQTNFLGHFLLTNELLDCLQGGRVVNLASVMHHFCAHNESHDQDYWRECATSTEESYYAPSKLAAILFTLELNRRYTASRRIRSMAVNPGAV